jgi:2-polyprenyl-3-methyl-5-hydroxy-6-metoxy-1,4-benzoquinol methylase
VGVTPDPISEGHYARKQIHCPTAVVAWSHRSRFRLAVRLATKRGGRLLDYGCGDGTFIAMAHGSFAEAIGADADAAQIVDCRQRLAHLPGVSFVVTPQLDAPLHAHAFDVVTCMEVLEHCTDAERARVLDSLVRLTAYSGRLIISVPIEIGPAVLGKQLFRALAAWRGHGDYQYRETYTPRELLAAALARPNLRRAIYTVTAPDGEYTYCGHKGFDWRRLEKDLRNRMIVERRMFTPLPLLGRLLNSQVWFVCSLRR